MALLLLLARLLLALVFVVAGLAELAVALALLPAISAWWGSLDALALLLLFVAAIGYNLAQGRTPDCHCFGQLHSAPVDWPTLIRSLLLAGLAAFKANSVAL
jgi:hypothetical protein